MFKFFRIISRFFMALVPVTNYQSSVLQYYTYKARSDSDNLKRDWQRINDDFRKVL